MARVQRGFVSHTCQKMLLALAPFTRMIFLETALVNVEPIWKIQTASPLFPASRVRSVDNNIEEPDLYRPGSSVIPDMPVQQCQQTNM